MDDTTGTVFRDVILIALLGFIAILILILPYINPLGKETNEDIRAPGNVLIEAIWNGWYNVDVDLWVQVPGDRPVGYSNMGGRVYNLLRDDLGHISDSTPFNYESGYTRGIPAGEYTVNVHLFRQGNALLPLPVTIIVSTKIGYNAVVRQIIKREVKLSELGMEITVMRFRLNNEGILIPSSIHALFKGLRSTSRSRTFP